MLSPTASNGRATTGAVGQEPFSVAGRWAINMTCQYTRIVEQGIKHDRISE